MAKSKRMTGVNAYYLVSLQISIKHGDLVLASCFPTPRQLVLKSPIYLFVVNPVGKQIEQFVKYINEKGEMEKDAGR